MKILAESTLTSKEQLTVPKIVRQLLDLHAGDSLVWSLDAAGRLVVSGKAGQQTGESETAVLRTSLIGSSWGHSPTGRSRQTV
jgi:bifunctional DNA-binding transcriptional regulator/antitoxin component of YhaV-PrlF toxin-antitoxin module